MDATTYAVEAEIEQSHWWFCGRRELFARELAHAGSTGTERVLDVGTGTGANLRLLQKLGYRQVSGLDASEEAIQYCAAKGLGRVERGDICAMPFADASFDIVLATDVIEHVDDDARALREIARVLAPGGKLLLTVPAFPSLWGLQDERARHKRRYRLQALLPLMRGAGLMPRVAYHFNYLLFLPIWAARRLIDALGLKLDSEAQINTPTLNRVLAALFALDIRTAPWLRPPFGVSILVVAEHAGTP